MTPARVRIAETIASSINRHLRIAFFDFTNIQYVICFRDKHLERFPTLDKALWRVYCVAIEPAIRSELQPKHAMTTVAIAFDLLTCLQSMIRRELFKQHVPLTEALRMPQNSHNG